MPREGGGGRGGERACHLGHLAAGTIDRANCKMAVIGAFVSNSYIVCCTGHRCIHVEGRGAKREDVWRSGGGCCRLQEQEDEWEREDKERGHVCTLLGEASSPLV